MLFSKLEDTESKSHRGDFKVQPYWGEKFRRATAIAGLGGEKSMK